MLRSPTGESEAEEEIGVREELAGRRDGVKGHTTRFEQQSLTARKAMRACAVIWSTRRRLEKPVR
jgi:hypothetical protein